MCGARGEGILMLDLRFVLYIKFEAIVNHES